MQQPGKSPRIQLLPKMLIDMSGTTVDQLMPVLPLLFSFLFVFYQHHHKLIQIHMITVPVLLLLQWVHRKRLVPARLHCHGQVRRTQPCHLRQCLPDQSGILHFHTVRFQRGTANAPALHIAQHFTVDRTDDLHIPRLPVIDLVTDTAVYRNEIPCLQQVRSPVCPHMHLSLDTIKNLRMVMPVDTVYHHIDHHHRNRNPQHIRRPVCLIISPHIHAPAFAACSALCRRLPVWLFIFPVSVLFCTCLILYLFYPVPVLKLFCIYSILCLLKDYSIIDHSDRILNAFCDN